MNQSRKQSLIEAVVNVLIGFGINFTANMFVLPMLGFQITVADNLAMGAIFTVISVARSYVLRRWFNARLHAMAARLAGNNQPQKEKA